MFLSLLILGSLKVSAGVIGTGTPIHDAVPPREGYIAPASETPATPPSQAPANSTPTCAVAYENGMNSPSTGEVEEAADICKAALNAMCAFPGGTGDQRYLSANCQLEAAHAGNAAVNDERNNRGSRKCEKSYAKAKSDGSTGAANIGALDCQSETDKKCSPEESTGDARLVAAVCKLRAAHAGYLKAKN